MAIQASDYQVTDYWIDGDGITMQNVYFYRNTGGSQSAANLAKAVQDSLGPSLSDILSNDMVQVKTEAFNLVTPTDFFTEPGTWTGTGTGDNQPSFVAASFTISRSDRTFRNSGKRYGRLVEGDTVGNNFSGAATIRMENMRLALENEVIRAGTTYQLMIPKRVKTANPSAPPAFIYVLNDLSIPAGVLSPKVSSQNSRKR